MSTYYIFLIEVLLIYNVVLVSCVEQSDSDIYIYIYVCVCVYIYMYILFHYGLLQEIEYSSLHDTVGPYCLCFILCWPKGLFEFFHNILWKIFGQPNI